MSVSAEDFVKLWQAASSAQEVCEATGMTLDAVRARAGHYRRKGVPLKRMALKTGPKPADWTKLAELARAQAEQNGHAE
jgi:hypothetical protein